jgi:outer membrane cobalamin receptor
LLSLEITSAGRRQQRAEDVAAAVYVITQEDIRRSGLTLLPEILRLAPGVQVARLNANKWAISVRGFNSIYSNKLLILLDGRSLFNRAFAGVLWDGLDLDIDEIERIEIVRGPGGAMWGSNAINGSSTSLRGRRMRRRAARPACRWARSKRAAARCVTAAPLAARATGSSGSGPATARAWTPLAIPPATSGTR